MVNGILKAKKTIRDSRGVDLNDISRYKTFEVGYLKNSRSYYFKGEIRSLRIWNRAFPIKTTKPIVKRSSKLILSRRVFNGRNGINVRRVEMARSSWTLKVLIKVTQKKYQFIFANYKTQHMFYIHLHSNNAVCIYLRRRIGTRLSWIYLRTSSNALRLNRFENLQIVWNRQRKTLAIMINGKVKALKTIRDSKAVNFNDVSRHRTFEVGY